MNLTVEIPDDVAKRLSAGGGDLSRRALEALAAEEYRQGRLNKPDLRRLLGFSTSDQSRFRLKWRTNLPTARRPRPFRPRRSRSR